jgi:hypothetical protein
MMTNFSTDLQQFGHAFRRPSTPVDVLKRAQFMLNMDDIAQLPTVQRYRELKSFYGTSLEQTPQEEMGEIRTLQQVQRTEQQLRQAGLGEDLNEYLYRDGETFLGSAVLGRAARAVGRPLFGYFDLMNIVNYTSAGYVHELLRTGSASEAFSQAVAEFANALPLINVERARKASWGDVLREIGMDETSPYLTAAAGFVLDVALDPISYVGPGAILRGIKKGAKAAKADKVWNIASDSQAGAYMRRMFIKDYVTKQKYKVIDPEAYQAYEYYLSAHRANRTRSFEDMARLVKQNVPEIEHMTDNLLIGVLREKPDYLRKSVDHLVREGVIDKRGADKIFEISSGMSKHFGDLQRMEQQTGLLPHVSTLDNYALHTAPITEASKKIHREMGMEGVAIRPEARRTLVEATGREDFVRALGQAAPKTARPELARSEGLETVLDRIMEGIPTELMATGQIAQRSLATVNYISGAKLRKAVLTDPRTAMPIRLLVDPPGKEKAARVGAKQVLEAKGKAAPSPGKVPIWENRKLFNDLRSDLQQYGYDALELHEFDTLGKKITTGAFVVPSQVAKDIGNIDKFMRPEVFDPSAKEFYELMEKAIGFWRGWAIFAPGFHTRNMLSELFYNWIGGVGSKWTGTMPTETPGKFWATHLKAEQVQLAYEGPEATSKFIRGMLGPLFRVDPSKPVKILHKKTGKYLTGQQVQDEAVNRGVLHGLSKADPRTAREIIAGRMPSSREDVQLLGEAVARMDGIRWDKTRSILGADAILDDKVLRDESILRELLSIDVREGQMEAFNKVAGGIFGRRGKLMEANQAVAAHIDNNARLAMFIDRIEKGFDFDQAAQAVKMYHYMPGNITEAENRIFRMVIPFYNWMRFNTPLMLTSMLDRPDKYAKIPKLKQAIEGIKNDMADAPTPDYFQKQFNIMLPFMREQRPLYLTPDLPFMDLNNFNRKDFFSGLNPVASILHETLGGRVLFTGAEIERYPGELSEEFPFVSKAVLQTLQTVVPPLGRLAVRPYRAYKRGELPELLFSELTGIKTQPIDVSRVMRGQTYKRRQLISDFTRRYLE